MNSLLIALAAVSGALATSPSSSSIVPSHPTYGEHPCDAPGLKTCGDKCILSTWTCCPRKDGGCPPESECFIGDDDETLCCLYGGCSTVVPGTAITTWETTITCEATITVDYPSDETPTPTTTITLEPTDGVTTVGTGTETETGTAAAPKATGATGGLAANVFGAVVAAGAALFL